MPERWTSTGVPEDTINVWTGNMGFASWGKVSYMEPVQPYADYLRGQYASDPPSYEYALKNSNPETVAQIDAIAAEFNADLDRIKKENDVEAALGFAHRAHVIFRGREGKF